MMGENHLVRVRAKWRTAQGWGISPDTGKLAYIERKMGVVRCPFCGQQHEHGWNTGPRRPHCDKPPSEDYLIVCDDDAEPAPSPRRRRAKGG